MITPHALWSVALVVSACGLVGGRPGGAVARVQRRLFARSMVASLALLLAVVATATTLADALAVTPPTVRLSAGVAVALSAIASLLIRSGTLGAAGVAGSSEANGVNGVAGAAGVAGGAMAAAVGEAAGNGGTGGTGGRGAGPGVAPTGVQLLQWALAGPLRVEVAVALWAATLDQGTTLGALSAVLATGLSAWLALAAGAKGVPFARRALAVSALCVAVVVAVNGVLGL